MPGIEPGQKQWEVSTLITEPSPLPVDVNLPFLKAFSIPA